MNVVTALLALPARPITSLPAPPPGAPEFGLAPSPARSRSSMQAKLARLCDHHPSLKRFGTGIFQEAPSIPPVQIALGGPVRLPPPPRPAVWLNQPYPVALPEPGSLGTQQPESPTLAPPGDNENSQPMPGLSLLLAAPLP